MDYGYFGFNIGALSNAGSVERVAVTAEQLGYESVWTGEHLFLMDPQQPSLLGIPWQERGAGTASTRRRRF